MAFLAGCNRPAACKVIQYGPQYLTYTGSRERFDEVCRTVLHDLSYKEKVDENSTRYPYYGEGASSHKSDGKSIAVTVYLKTKDADNAEYKITTLYLGNRDPVVMLESTSADPYKLINALNAEFPKRGIRVEQY
jgi:hypothetical protein